MAFFLDMNPMSCVFPDHKLHSLDISVVLKVDGVVHRRLYALRTGGVNEVVLVARDDGDLRDFGGDIGESVSGDAVRERRVDLR